MFSKACNPARSQGGVILLTLWTVGVLAGCGLSPNLPGSIPNLPTAPGADTPQGAGDLDAGTDPSVGETAPDPDGDYHLFDGGETDLDGDGTPDVFTYQDGGYLFTEPLHGYGVSRVVSPDGSSRLVIDEDGDGLPEVEEANWLNDSVYGTSEAKLLDGAGSLQRVTTLWHLDTLMMERTTEAGVRSDGGDVYQVVSTVQQPYLGEASGGGGGTCDPFQGFPERKGTPVKDFPNIEIVADGLDGACPKEMADHLADLIQHKSESWKQCLGAHNKELNEKWAENLRKKKLKIACSNLCPGDVGHTDPVGLTQSGPFLPKISLNLTALDYEYDDAPWLNTPAHQEVTLLHELIHFMGLGHADETGNNRRDPIYACSRLCGGCDIEQVPMGGGYINGAEARAENCAACGDVNHKGACGYRMVVKPAPCAQDNCVPDDINHSFQTGSGCFNYAATFCDGTLYQPAGALGSCPGTCPAGTHSRCEGYNPQDLPDTCNQVPAECAP